MWCVICRCYTYKTLYNTLLILLGYGWCRSRPAIHLSTLQDLEVDTLRLPRPVEWSHRSWWPGGVIENPELMSWQAAFFYLQLLCERGRGDTGDWGSKKGPNGLQSTLRKLSWHSGRWLVLGLSMQSTSLIEFYWEMIHGEVQKSPHLLYFKLNLCNPKVQSCTAHQRLVGKGWDGLLGMLG